MNAKDIDLVKGMSMCNERVACPEILTEQGMFYT
jgi:hypothetical protein